MGNWNADSVQVSDSDGSDSEADADDLAAVFHQVEFFGKSWRRRFFSRFPPLQAVWAKSVDYDRLESSEPKRITHFFEIFNETLAKIESPSAGSSSNPIQQCQRCNNVYHLACLKPSLSERPEGIFVCCLVCAQEVSKILDELQ